MKFGRNLHSYQVVEWAPYYIDYQALKKLHKAAKRLAIDQGEDANLTGLLHIISLRQIMMSIWMPAKQSLVGPL